LLACPAQAAEFTYQNVLLAYIKLSHDFPIDYMADDLMQVFRPEIWQRVHNDEFALQKRRAETLAMIRNNLALLSPGEEFTLQTAIQFGAYDFNAHKFDLHPFTEATYFPVEFCCTDLPSRIRVGFANPGLLDGLPLPEASARALLSKHANNRELQALVRFRMQSAAADYHVTAVIDQVDVLDPANGNRVLYSVHATSVAGNSSP
jgi:hypothetical protein